MNPEIEPPDEEKIDAAPMLCLVGAASVLVASVIIGAIIRIICK